MIKSWARCKITAIAPDRRGSLRSALQPIPGLLVVWIIHPPRHSKYNGSVDNSSNLMLSYMVNPIRSSYALLKQSDLSISVPGMYTVKTLARPVVPRGPLHLCSVSLTTVQGSDFIASTSRLTTYAVSGVSKCWFFGYKVQFRISF